MNRFELLEDISNLDSMSSDEIVDALTKEPHNNGHKQQKQEAEMMHADLPEESKQPSRCPSSLL